ncbi:Signal transducing histidine kinase, homodimeric domain [Halanaerobium congolense]|uniref:histidine kinase n=2 Tax=Halanaerobium congolense TaxID=54121 RepID=A0ABY0NWK6_9FIRM|nr:chemotaxis protein CheW [Halanaerobium congolense]PTX14788.1 signal transduction histidine kinase-like protein [Halanaerobium congolense]SDG27346.1 Signal transducing histidine kinase, homodimeric domain [Halanaerobium congolense]SFP82589.1 Signal transducing histidine kinase, homodimeric domain [Halanaerobium congolense]
MNKKNNLDLENLDEIMDLVGELLISKSRLETLEAFKDQDRDILSQLDRITGELHDKVMKVRMIPLANIFQEFNQIIKASKTKIELDIEGKDIEVDRAVINKLADPLSQFLKSLVSNIEEQKIQENTKEEITEEISIKATKTGNEVIIEFEDNAKLIDLDQLQEKIIDNNILSKEELEKMSKEEIYNLILKDNISAEKAAEDAGQKIAAVKSIKKDIEAINGDLYLELSEDNNLKTVIIIPLKFAITEALMVKVDGDLFAIPLEMVSETKRIPNSKIKKVKNEDVINYRENTIPLIDSYDFLNFNKEVESDSSASEIEVVIVNTGKKNAALRVDELLNQQDIVVKSLGELLSNTKNIAGATIIGDGEIALIIDVREIA